jgi:hypothetical protein
MTRMTVRTKIAVASVLAAAGLIVAGVRLDRTARAQGPERARPEKPPLQASVTTADPPNRPADAGRGRDVHARARHQLAGRPPPSWQRNQAREVTGGRYEISFSEPYPFRLVRIEAPGYLPAVSRAFKPEDGEQVLDFKLEKGRDVVGVVRTPDGMPLVGADVVLPRTGPTEPLPPRRRRT